MFAKLPGPGLALTARSEWAAEALGPSTSCLMAAHAQPPGPHQLGAGNGVSEGSMPEVHE